MKVPKEQMAAWKVANPLRFATLEAQAKKELLEALAAQQAGLEYARLEGAAKLREYEKFNTALLNPGLPDFEFLEGSYGLLAQRAWHVTFEGGLRSTVMNVIWKQIMFADKVPTESNVSGLYCNAIDPSGLMLSGFHYLASTDVQGIIECRGKVVQHSDGVVRTECAKILCLIILGDNAEVYNLDFIIMRHRYFPIPVFVMTSPQYAEFLFRLLTLVRLGSE